jgi:hypothetical protein
MFYILRFALLQVPNLTPYDCSRAVRLGEAEAKRICSEGGSLNSADHIYLTRYSEIKYHMRNM